MFGYGQLLELVDSVCVAISGDGDSALTTVVRIKQTALCEVLAPH